MRWQDGTTNTRILDTLNSETTYWIWKPGKLQYMGLQKEEYELPTELK